MDLVSRLLLLKIEKEWKEQGPATTLRAVGGLSTFLKSRVPITGDRVRTFLIQEQSFPRSLLEASKDAEDALREICSFNGLSPGPILRPIGLLKSEILFLDDNSASQDEIVHKTPLSVEETSEAVRKHFFRPTGSIVWSN